MDHIEETTRLDLVGVVWQFTRPWPGSIGRKTLADLLVNALNVMEESVTLFREDMLRVP